MDELAFAFVSLRKTELLFHGRNGVFYFAPFQRSAISRATGLQSPTFKSQSRRQTGRGKARGKACNSSRMISSFSGAFYPLQRGVRFRVYVIGYCHLGIVKVRLTSSSEETGGRFRHLGRLIPKEHPDGVTKT